MGYALTEPKFDEDRLFRLRVLERKLESIMFRTYGDSKWRRRFNRLRKIRELMIQVRGPGA